MFMRHIDLWLRAARAPFFTGSLAPILVGTAAAYHVTGWVQWDLAILALVSLTLLHASANLSNDFFDHLTGDDAINVSFATPFTGGSRVIQRGEVRPWEMLLVSLMCMGVAAVIGFYLVHRGGWMILWLGLLGGLTGFLYTAPPFRFVYRGLGELFIFLDFGMLPVVGAFYLQTGQFSPTAFWAGVPVGLLITGILWINQFQDMEADAASGKRNGVVALGRAKSARLHVAMFVATYLSIIVPVIAGLFPPPALLALLSLPLAVKASLTALRHHDDLPHLTPANAATIGAHLATSVLLAVGLALPQLLG